MRTNPQKENGYTAIANEIMEALAGIRISGEARQCLDIILRKTYGFNKKEDLISLSQFCLLSKMTKDDVCRALRKLVEINIIIVKKDNSYINSYRFNKDYSTWKPLSKKTTLSKKTITIVNIDNKPLSKKTHTIVDNTKTTITKENIVGYVGEEKNQIIPNLLNDKQKHIQIIGLYAKSKNINFTSKEHQQSFIERNVREASNLICYDLSRITEVLCWLSQNADFKFTLETIGKYIDEDLSKIKQQPRFKPKTLIAY